MEEAFRVGAGFNASDLQFFVRGFLAALFSLWAIWVIYNQFKLVVSEQLTTVQWVFNSLTTVIILTLVLIIVAN